MSVESTTDATFATDVLAANGPVLVDFWAPWCGPCRQVAPILEELAAEYPESITVVKLNVDENPQTASTYGVISIPTMNVYVNGEVVSTITGAKPKKKLVAELRDYLNGA